MDNITGPGYTLYGYTTYDLTGASRRIGKDCMMPYSALKQGDSDKEDATTVCGRLPLLGSISHRTSYDWTAHILYHFSTGSFDHLERSKSLIQPCGIRLGY